MKYFLGKKYKDKIELEYDDLTLSDTKPDIDEEICWGMDIKEINKYVNNEITIYLENEDNKVIGFINFTINKRKNAIVVNRLCSMKAYKGRGNGKKLLLTLIDIATNLGFEYISLIPKLDSKLKVVQFYREIGFEPDEDLGLTFIYRLRPSSGGKTRRRRYNKKGTRRR